MINKNFYYNLEQKFRCSREEVKLRMRFYLTFIKTLAVTFNNAKALDLGCGRGEWLELLKEWGIDALGVDCDETMLKACRDRTLTVIQDEVIDYLSRQSDQSYDLITGFHIAEHLIFPQLLQLVEQSLRILRPGGLLILESPNPENLLVATNNFYIDPTHLRPLVPKFLFFLSEYTGFIRTKIVRLNGQKEFLENQEITLSNLFLNVSPDFAIIAQKNADPKVLQKFDTLFDKDYGHDFEKLLDIYEQQNYIRNQKNKETYERIKNINDHQETLWETQINLDKANKSIVKQSEELINQVKQELLNKHEMLWKAQTDLNNAHKDMRQQLEESVDRAHSNQDFMIKNHDKLIQNVDELKGQFVNCLEEKIEEIKNSVQISSLN